MDIIQVAVQMMDIISVIAVYRVSEREWFSGDKGAISTLNECCSCCLAWALKMVLTLRNYGQRDGS